MDSVYGKAPREIWLKILGYLDGLSLFFLCHADPNLDDLIFDNPALSKRIGRPYKRAVCEKVHAGIAEEHKFMKTPEFKNRKILYRTPSIKDSYIHKLPMYLWLRIFRCLDETSLISVSEAHVEWNELITGNNALRRRMESFIFRQKLRSYKREADTKISETQQTRKRHRP